MGVSGRADKSALQAKAADESLACFVQNELQLQAGSVLRAATKALVPINTLFDLMSVDRLVPGHVTKMKQSRRKMQEEPLFAVRPSLFAPRSSLFARTELFYISVSS